VIGVRPQGCLWSQHWATDIPPSPQQTNRRNPCYDLFGLVSLANDSTKFIFGSSRHQISKEGPNARVTGVYKSVATPAPTSALYRDCETNYKGTHAELTCMVAVTDVQRNPPQFCMTRYCIPPRLQTPGLRRVVKQCVLLHPTRFRQLCLVQNQSPHLSCCNKGCGNSHPRTSFIAGSAMPAPCPIPATGTTTAWSRRRPGPSRAAGLAATPENRVPPHRKKSTQCRRTWICSATSAVWADFPAKPTRKQSTTRLGVYPRQRLDTSRNATRCLGIGF